MRRYSAGSGSSVCRERHLDQTGFEGGRKGNEVGAVSDSQGGHHACDMFGWAEVGSFAYRETGQENQSAVVFAFEERGR